jgi:hypothetical protein
VKRIEVLSLPLPKGGFFVSIFGFRDRVIRVPIAMQLLIIDLPHLWGRCPQGEHPA